MQKTETVMSQSKPASFIARKAIDATSGQGAVFYLVMSYVFLDLVRPSFVWHFPKIIGVLLVLAWMSKEKKVFGTQIICFLLFTGVLFVDVFIAENTYDAVWFSYGVFTLLIGVCIPLINFTDTLPKLKSMVNALLIIFLYIGVYAIFNAGFGPAGTAGGQDENYVSAAMDLAIPLAGFSFFAERSKWKKMWFAGLVCVYILAIVVGLSRGGFVGLLCALGYSFMKAPRKGLAISAAIVIAAVLLLAGGSSYWQEMQTITDTSEGTADLRLELWEVATREFLGYPLTGVGGGNFHWRIAEFQSPEQIAKFDRYLAAEVHSTYFQLLAETGLAGCIVFGVMMLRTYRDYRFIESLYTKDDQDDPSKDDYRWMQNYARGIIGGLIGYLGAVAFVSALYYSHLWFAVSLMVSLYLIAMQRVTRDRTSVLADRSA